MKACPSFVSSKTRRSYVPYTSVVAVHMGAINDCILTRSELRDLLDRENLSKGLHIPTDGERMEFRGFHCRVPGIRGCYPYVPACLRTDLPPLALL